LAAFTALPTGSFATTEAWIWRMDGRLPPRSLLPAAWSWEIAEGAAERTTGAWRGESTEAVPGLDSDGLVRLESSRSCCAGASAVGTAKRSAFAAFPLLTLLLGEAAGERVVSAAGEFRL
jgi:hypothetical protein